MTVAREHLLPANATPMERALSDAAARIQDVDADVIRRSRRGATAPLALLPMLAAERSLHHPSPDEATQRARIDASFGDHLSYGSPAALEIEIALDTGAVIHVVEAHERADLEWPDFMVEAVIAPGDPSPDVAAIAASALRRKNVRDWPRVRIRGLQPTATLAVAAASHVSPRVRVHPEGAHRPPPQIHIGAAARTLIYLKILPQRAA